MVDFSFQNKSVLKKNDNNKKLGSLWKISDFDGTFIGEQVLQLI